MSSTGNDQPRVFNVLEREALRMRDGKYGQVGTLYSGEGIEVVWVSKQDEPIDTGWFSQETVDVLLVVRGRLMVEFERSELESRVIETGEILILPASLRCRAYRWPRDSRSETIFVAFYPTRGEH